LDFLPLTPGRGYYPQSENSEKEAGDFKPQNSRSASGGFSNRFGRRDSTTHGLMPISQLPEHPADSLRPLKISHISHV
jgi:hypothetical protein